MEMFYFILSIVWWKYAAQDPPLLAGGCMSCRDIAASLDRRFRQGRLGRVCIHHTGYHKQAA